MDEIKFSPEEIKESLEAEAHAHIELDDKTFETGSSLERTGSFLDAEAIQALIAELTQGLTESFSNALEAYRTKVAENALERQGQLLENREAIYTESQARAMVETALKAYQQGYQDALAAVQTTGAGAPPDQKLEDEEIAFQKPGGPGVPIEGDGEPLPESSEQFREIFGEDPELLGTYTMHPNETLSSIAMEYYGQPELWPVIYEANRGKIGNDPNQVYPGIELDIPSLEAVSEESLRMFNLSFGDVWDATKGKIGDVGGWVKDKFSPKDDEIFNPKYSGDNIPWEELSKSPIEILGRDDAKPEFPKPDIISRDDSKVDTPEIISRDDNTPEPPASESGKPQVEF